MSEARFVVDVPLLNFRSAPEKDPGNILGKLTRNHTVHKVADAGTAGWWEAEAALDGVLTPGFLELKHLKPKPSPSQLKLDADTLIDLARTFARQYQTSSVLLIGIAHAESGLEPTAQDDTGRIGLFGFRREQWNALIEAHPDTQVTRSMIDDWSKQTIMAAVACAGHGQALKDALHRRPTALEIYAAHHLGLVAAKALVAADEAATVDVALSPLRLADAELAQVMQADPDILGNLGSPARVSDAMGALKTRLAEGLGQATELTRAVVGDNLGVLSRAHESNGDPGAIGFDDAGGWSYGLYQLASAENSVKNFLVFLRDKRPDLVDTLEAAGGDSAARAGSAAFKKAWQSLAANPEFSAAQHEFIKTQYFDVSARKLDAQGFSVANRSAALQNVIWSTSVQHGASGAVELFESALQPSVNSPQWSDDKAVINAVYDERSKLDTYFPRARTHWAGLESRFITERAQALTMLG